MHLDTDGLAARFRSRVLDLQGRRILITNYSGTLQEVDLTEPANCAGFGRIRHFKRFGTKGWPANPLPLDPAFRALGMQTSDEIHAQVFQNAACNWRCWFCFVPFQLLSGREEYSGWFSAAQLVELLSREEDPPRVLDLSGGEPGLTPEWVLWMILELRQRGLQDRFYLWSDDNLSTDYFWSSLTESEQETIVSYPMYGHVGCFKGFDENSFSYNTRAAPHLFERQFDLMGRLLRTGMDIYSYVTLTTPERRSIRDGIRHFVDELQELDANLPLRTVPLEVRVFSPVQPRITVEHRASLTSQWIALEAWQRELQDRFPGELRGKPITDVPLRGRRLSTEANSHG